MFVLELLSCPVLIFPAHLRILNLDKDCQCQMSALHLHLLHNKIHQLYRWHFVDYYPSLEIYGSGEVSTYLEWSGAASSFNIDFPTLGNITLHDMTVTTDGSNPITSFLNFTNNGNTYQFWSSNVAYQWDNLPINFFNGLSSGNGLITNFVNCVMVGNVTFTNANQPISFFGGLLRPLKKFIGRLSH